MPAGNAGPPEPAQDVGGSGCGGVDQGNRQDAKSAKTAKSQGVAARGERICAAREQVDDQKYRCCAPAAPKNGPDIAGLHQHRQAVKTGDSTEAAHVLVGDVAAMSSAVLFHNCGYGAECLDDMFSQRVAHHRLPPFRATPAMATFA